MAASNNDPAGSAVESWCSVVRSNFNETPTLPPHLPPLREVLPQAFFIHMLGHVFHYQACAWFLHLSCCCPGPQEPQSPQVSNSVNAGAPAFINVPTNEGLRLSLNSPAKLRHKPQALRTTSTFPQNPQHTWVGKERFEVLILFMASLKRSAEEMEANNSGASSASATPTPATVSTGALKLEGPLPMLCVLDLDKTVSHHLTIGIVSC